MRLSPDGGWVAFTISTRVEETNGNESQGWLVATDGSGEPRRIQHQGQEVSGLSWTEDGRLRYSADGLWSIDPADPSALPRPKPVSPLPAT